MILNILVTLIYTVVTFVGAFSTTGAAVQDKNEAWSLEAYLTKIEQRVEMGQKLSFGLIPAERFEVEFDEVVTGLFDEIEAYSGFDAERVAASWPDIYYYNRWLYSLMPGAMNALRDDLMGKADQFEAEKDWNRMAVYRTAGVSFGMPTKILLAGEETKTGSGVYDIIIYATYGDGSTVRFNPNIQYNTIYGDVNQRHDHPSGIVGTGFAMNVAEGYAFNTPNSPQRALGYMKLYDDLFLRTSDMVNLDTMRLKFEYQGRDWMIQMWKGRYFVTTGGELGIYNKPKDRLVEFYDAATNDELIPMSFRIKLLETDEYIIDRPLTTHWWMTGYAVQKMVYGPSKLALETEIKPYDDEFSKALQGALDVQVAAKQLTYTVQDDGIISIAW